MERIEFNSHVLLLLSLTKKKCLGPYEIYIFFSISVFSVLIFLDSINGFIKNISN